MSLRPDHPAELLPASGGSTGAAAASTAARRVGGWLCLAAAPVFAIMALLTSIYGSPDICSVAPDAFPLGGMVPMYLLMSAFHLSPWLKLITEPLGRS